MIRINKRPENEPQSWINYRRTPGAVYGPSNDLRDALLAEQGYICAYCMCRIPVTHPQTTETSKIEHVISRKDRPDLQLNYANMAICCPGNTDNTPHCDQLKASDSVSFNLNANGLQDSISYSSRTGKIESSNKTWDKEINKTINLNHNRIKENRVAELNGVIESIFKKGKKHLDIETVIAEWSEPDNQGRLKPYCGIVIWYLEKKLRQNRI